MGSIVATARGTWLGAALVVALAPPAFAGEAAAPGAVPSGSVLHAAPRAETTSAELDAMLTALDAAEAAERTKALAAVAGLGPEAVPAMAKKLAELRKAPSAPVALAVRSAREKSAKDADVGDALAQARPEGAAKPALVTAALLRGLAHAGTTAAARQLVRVAGDHGGAFRPEIARHVKALGDAALPALIETKKDASPEVRHWAYAQLEGMGKRLPGDAVQTKDNQILAEVLHAYGVVHDLDAVPVILSFVNADRAPVRTAAREAIGAFDRDAIWKLREAYANVVGKPADDAWSPAEVAKGLFAAYDKLRLAEVYGLLDAGLAAERAGKLDEAVSAFDRVLARQPALDRRGETVPAYVAYAEKLAPSDPQAARAAYEKALRLANDGPRAPHIRAELAYLDARDLLARGISDRASFERVLALEPEHAGARAELAKMEATTADRAWRVQAGIAAAALFVVMLIAAVLFTGRRRRPLRTT